MVVKFYIALCALLRVYLIMPHNAILRTTSNRVNGQLKSNIGDVVRLSLLEYDSANNYTYFLDEPSITLFSILYPFLDVRHIDELIRDHSNFDHIYIMGDSVLDKQFSRDLNILCADKLTLIEMPDMYSVDSSSLPCSWQEYLLRNLQLNINITEFSYYPPVQISNDQPLYDIAINTIVHTSGNQRHQIFYGLTPLLII